MSVMLNLLTKFIMLQKKIQIIQWNKNLWNRLTELNYY